MQLIKISFNRDRVMSVMAEWIIQLQNSTCLAKQKCSGNAGKRNRHFVSRAICLLPPIHRKDKQQRIDAC
jgi:hypothetical protein